jgi:DHA1 family multidrug resistance protein-like MFS transporter
MMDRLRSWRATLAVPWHRTLLVIFLAQLTTAVGFSSIFPFLPLYVQSLGSTTGTDIEVMAGLVFSAQAFTMMIASPIWGAVADRFGRKLMVQRAMFGGSIILLLMAFVRSSEELVVLRAIQGTITGTVAASNALVAAVAPRHRTGFAMGLLQVGLGAGVALGPLIGGALADAFGYRSAFFVTSAMLLVSGWMVRAWVHEGFVAPAGGNGPASWLKHWQAILTTHGVRITYAMRFISQLGQQMIVPMAPLFIESLMANSSLVNTMTGLVVGTSAAFTTLSAVYLGRLGDRIGHRRVLIFSCLGAALFYWPASLVGGPWQLLALQAAVGIALGGVVPSISALLAAYTSAGEEGAVYGLDNSIRSGARSVAPLAGSGVAIAFGLRGVFVAAAAVFGLALLMAVLWLPQTASAAMYQAQAPARPGDLG